MNGLVPTRVSSRGGVSICPHIVACITFLSSWRMADAGHLARKLRQSEMPNMFNAFEAVRGDTSINELQHSRRLLSKTDLKLSHTFQGDTSVGYVKWDYDVALPASTVPLDLYYADTIHEWQFSCKEAPRGTANPETVFSLHIQRENGSEARAMERDLLNRLQPGHIIVFGPKTLDEHPSLLPGSSCDEIISLESPYFKIVHKISELDGESLSLDLSAVGVAECFSDFSWSFTWDPNNQRPDAGRQALEVVKSAPVRSAADSDPFDSRHAVTERSTAATSVNEVSVPLPLEEGARSLQSNGYTCLDGWKYDASTNKCYLYRSDALAWSDAAASCQSYGYGASLVTATSSAEGTTAVKQKCAGMATASYWTDGIDPSKLVVGADVTTTARDVGWTWGNGDSTSYLFSSGTGSGQSLWSSGWPKDKTCDVCVLVCFGCLPAPCLYVTTAGQLRNERCTNTMAYCCGMSPLAPSTSSTFTPSITPTSSITSSASSSRSPSGSTSPSASNTPSISVTGSVSPTVGTSAAASVSTSASASQMPSVSGSISASATRPPSTTASTSAIPTTSRAPSSSITASPLPPSYCPNGWDVATTLGSNYCSLAYEISTTLTFAEAYKQCNDMAAQAASVLSFRSNTQETSVVCLSFFPAPGSIPAPVAPVADGSTCLSDSYIDDPKTKGIGFNYNFRTRSASKPQLSIFDRSATVGVVGTLSGTGQVTLECTDCYAFLKVGFSASMGFCAKLGFLHLGQCQNIGSGLWVRASADLFGEAGASSNLKLDAQGQVDLSIQVPQKELMPTWKLPSISMPIAGLIPLSIKPFVSLYGNASLDASLHAQGTAAVGFNAYGNISLGAALNLGIGDIGDSKTFSSYARPYFLANTNKGAASGFLASELNIGLTIKPTLTLELMGRVNISHGFQLTKKFSIASHLAFGGGGNRRLQGAQDDGYSIEMGVAVDSSASVGENTTLASFPGLMDLVASDPSAGEAMRNNSLTLDSPLAPPSNATLRASTVAIPTDVLPDCTTCSGSASQLASGGVSVAGTASTTNISNILDGIITTDTPAMPTALPCVAQTQNGTMEYALIGVGGVASLAVAVLVAACVHDISCKSNSPLLFKDWKTRTPLTAKPLACKPPGASDSVSTHANPMIQLKPDGEPRQSFASMQPRTTSRGPRV